PVPRTGAARAPGRFDPGSAPARRVPQRQPEIRRARADPPHPGAMPLDRRRAQRCRVPSRHQADHLAVAAEEARPATTLRPRGVESLTLLRHGVKISTLFVTPGDPARRANAGSTSVELA